MDDAISRSAVLEILDNEFNMPAEEREDAENEKDRAFNAGEINCARRSVRKVNALPALDAVPVVRCVDCKYRCTLICPMYHMEYCDDGDGLYCDYDVDRTDADGFCHLGERWEGEECVSCNTPD